MKTQSGAHLQSFQLGRGSVCTVSDQPPFLRPSLSSPHRGTGSHHSSIYFCLITVVLEVALEVVPVVQT